VCDAIVDGPTLLEVLQATAGEGLRADRLTRYGLSLVRALGAVPSAHLDLSPSNILVEDDSAMSAAARLVLIDFGENYLLTQNVAGGRVLAETTRYVAPELLGSRAPGQVPTGYEDVYSLGQILLELAGYNAAEAGYLPGELFLDAPLVGRLIEDLVDRSPDNRLLLSRLQLGVPLADQRREAYRELMEAGGCPEGACRPCRADADSVPAPAERVSVVPACPGMAGRDGRGTRPDEEHGWRLAGGQAHGKNTRPLGAEVLEVLAGHEAGRRSGGRVQTALSVGAAVLRRARRHLGTGPQAALAPAAPSLPIGLASGLAGRSDPLGGPYLRSDRHQVLARDLLDADADHCAQDCRRPRRPC
jgi:hypothetical protein